MGYLLYTLSFAVVVIGTALYFTRAFWLPYMPDLNLPNNPFYRYTRLSTFSDDLESGLTSSNFDLTINIEAGDSRQGLDDRGKKEVQRIMKNKRVGFDEARRIWMQERFKREGIGADGRPRDPKFVSFS
ncbi:hypothetical protein EJ05DRAFT_487660 [Pseudovirgaria hyperparasitica]|uniref:Uncharacterized protein n=1 Tax=Pseudovirgaria hyperparasitica TaxID=470096 RepID=A0A6A6VZZ3_9PEZI|nr:uncharacterized protein EJ05DRAFT_487660 [Pseudovirgaria hyperparasitica]KAF2755825.1 hypothetical protein EJ05DRAFT_487660 [Pseudovirgaria hyperparasitica]